MKQKFSIAMSLAMIISMLLTSLGLASAVDVAVVDVVLPANGVTLAAGANAPITINMSVTGKQEGTATFEVYRDWTLSGGSFTGSNPQEFTVGPRAAGDAATTFSTSGNVYVAAGQSAGPFTLTVGVFDITNTNTTGAKLSAGALDSYQVTVSAPPPPPSNTAPSVSISGVADGASYNKGSVPGAICNVTDTEDGNSTFAATLSAISGPYASDGIGSQTASCSYTDAGNLTATASATYSIVDPSAPSIAYTLNPVAADGDNDWYTSEVTLTWTVTENESPNSLAKVGCVDQNITADQAATTYSCSASSAGGSATQVDVSIKRDATVPTISGSTSPSANGFGWNNDDVTVSFDCDDNLSGAASCGPDTTLTNEGAGQSVAGTAVDNAGNSAGTTVSGINIDKTAPSVALVDGPADGSSHYFGSVPAAPTCSASDALSGLDGSCSVSGYGTTVGSHTVTASASDNADNSNSASATYTVLAWTLNGFYNPVDMNNVVNVVKGGSTVPLKFEVFAGSTELNSTSVVASFVQTKIACDTSATIDEIEVVTTGGTSLRYDATAGQFIQNWQTPKSAGACYRVTMTTDDGSSLVAFFRLK